MISDNSIDFRTIFAAKMYTIRRPSIALYFISTLKYFASWLNLFEFCAPFYASFLSAPESLEVSLDFVYLLFWRSSICINCSMPIISSSPPGGCGFIAFEKEIKLNIKHKKAGKKHCVQIQFHIHSKPYVFQPVHMLVFRLHGLAAL